MPDLPVPAATPVPPGTDARRELAARVHALVCGQGFLPEWIVADAVAGGWEVTVGVDGRRWRFGTPAGRPFRLVELTPAGEVVLWHPPLADRDPATAWACAARLLAGSLRDPRFRGFDCPVN